MISQADGVQMLPLPRPTPRTPYTAHSRSTLKQHKVPPATITKKAKGARGVAERGANPNRLLKFLSKFYGILRM